MQHYTDLSLLANISFNYVISYWKIVFLNDRNFARHFLTQSVVDHHSFTKSRNEIQLNRHS